MTLIEILIAMVVLVLALLPLARLLIESVAASRDMGNYSAAMEAARGLLEEIKQRRWDENADPFTGYTQNPNDPWEPAAADARTPNSNLGPDPAENINDPRTLDDIDDFKGYRDWVNSRGERVFPPALPGGGIWYARTVDVIYVGTKTVGGMERFDLPANVGYGPPTNHKQITVVVEWPGRGVTWLGQGERKRVQVTSVQANLRRRR